MRASLLLVLGLFSFQAPQAPSQEMPEGPPNIVLLFADDAGYADFGFQGSGSHATPHIDSIATGGVRFTNAYVSASVCSPSRAGLLTGRYQQRFGHEYNLPGMPDEKVAAEMRGLPVGERTMADELKERGYATGVIGKWHLGKLPQFQPEQRGFDEFFGMLGGSSTYRPGKAKSIVSNYREVDTSTLPYLTDAFGDEAVGFIERHKAEPFFLYLSFNAPHGPLHARPDYLVEAREHFETEERAINAAMTRSLDDNIGKVLAKLEELGLAANTLVVFTNDNGGAMPYNASLNAPLRGTKGTCLEGGNRVPCAMRWPAVLGAGSVYEQPIISLDLLPTFVAATGRWVEDEGAAALDGVDLLPYLSGKAQGRPHAALFWKLNWGAAVRVGDWKLVRTPAGEHWLFDLSTDIGEHQDLAEQHPDKLRALRQRLETWESELPVPIWQSAPMWRKHSLERYDQERVQGFVRR
ncbi:MAG: arylsulfatase A-like enzyme [Planctomycetota bacterium]|jgi:arylsulfatase A-like enzyme